MHWYLARHDRGGLGLGGVLLVDELDVDLVLHQGEGGEVLQLGVQLRVGLLARYHRVPTDSHELSTILRSKEELFFYYLPLGLG